MTVHCKSHSWWAVHDAGNGLSQWLYRCRGLNWRPTGGSTSQKQRSVLIGLWSVFVEGLHCLVTRHSTNTTDRQRGRESESSTTHARVCLSVRLYASACLCLGVIVPVGSLTPLLRSWELARNTRLTCFGSKNHPSDRCSDVYLRLLSDVGDWFLRGYNFLLIPRARARARVSSRSLCAWIFDGGSSTNGTTSIIAHPFRGKCRKIGVETDVGSEL